MKENVIKMARLMGGCCKDRTCEDCLSQSKKLFGDTKCALIEDAEVLYKAGYREQRETTTFYKDPNIKDWAESEYAWCERPCDSNMSMRALDKQGSIVGYASEHYWTWCDVKEVKKVSAIEYMRHFASKKMLKENIVKNEVFIIMYKDWGSDGLHNYKFYLNREEAEVARKELQDMVDDRFLDEEGNVYPGMEVDWECRRQYFVEKLTRTSE